VNVTTERVEGTWRLGAPVARAWLARLDETPLAPLDAEPHAVSFDAPPRAIVTILARWTARG
jgi:hypothetical protein